jgi:predicted transposase YdaD
VNTEEQGERSLIVRQLTRRCGELSDEHQSQVHALSLTQLENLGEALLDFTDIADFEQWLQSQSES